MKLDKPLTMVSSYRSACPWESIALIDKKMGQMLTSSATPVPQANYTGKPLSVTSTDKGGDLNPKLPMRRPTPAQVEDYRKKSLCFKCDEPYTFEETDEGEEFLLELKCVKQRQDPEISLHAIEGTISPKIIRLLGLVNRKPVSLLLDTGSIIIS